MTSYQKLKIENTKLKSEMFELVTNPNSITSNLIKAKYKMSYKQLEEMLFGEFDEQKQFTTFDGLVTTASYRGIKK